MDMNQLKMNLFPTTTTATTTSKHHHHHHHHHHHNHFQSSALLLELLLPDDMYAWLESMAVEHNYGSVHKCIRDLLAWAFTGQREDLDWVFESAHNNNSKTSSTKSSSSSSSVCTKSSDMSIYDHDALAIVGKQACARLETAPLVALNARVSHMLHMFVVDVIEHYHLDGPSDVVERLVYCAIELQAAADIFDSHESGHDLAESTAELYHDLGLIRYVDTKTKSHSGTTSATSSNESLPISPLLSLH